MSIRANIYRWLNKIGVAGDLATERDRLQLILGAMREAVIGLDADGVITVANSSAVELIGSSGVPIGKTLVECLDIPALAEVVAKAKAGDAANVEFQLVGPPPRDILVRAASLEGSEGLVIVMHDVTEMKRIERMRRDFIANVSHELRTPLSVVKANAETLLDGALDDPVAGRRFVEGLSRNADRLSRLVEDLLALARIESGHFKLTIESVSVAEAVNRATDTVATLARRKLLSIEDTVDPGLRVRADMRAFEQIVTNLLDNAVKNTPEGGAIGVFASGSDDVIRVEVRDSGPGVEPRLRHRVFQRFFRADRGRSRNTGGTGLGLSIVKNLVESMGGHVGVESAQPHGAAFWFTLPATKDEPGK